MTRRNPLNPRLKHGMYQSAEYEAWHSMKSRCNRPKDASYSRYGGRGIGYDPKWNIFENFYADIGPRPDNFTLERLDSNKDYGPDNCIWADYKTQAQNRSDTPYLTVGNMTLSVSEWADVTGIPRWKIYQRVKRGWTTHRALEIGGVS